MDIKKLNEQLEKILNEDKKYKRTRGRKKYELKILVDRGRSSNGRVLTTNINANNDVDALLKVFTDFDLQNSGYFNGDYADDELDQEQLQNKNKVLAASNSGRNQEEAIEILNDFYFDDLDTTDYYDNIIYLKSPSGEVIIEDDLDLYDDEDEDDEDEDDEDEDDEDDDRSHRRSRDDEAARAWRMIRW